MKILNLIGLILYVIVITILPWYVAVGWNGLLLFPFIYLPSIILAPFIVIKLYNKPNNKWLITMLSLYIGGCLLFRDGGDGPAYQGFEIIFTNIAKFFGYFGQYHYFGYYRIVSEGVGEMLFNISLLLFLAFIVTEIVFLFKKHKVILVK